MTQPTTTYANKDDVLSEQAFLELTGLSKQQFRKLAREGELPGAVVLAAGKYVVVMSRFVEGTE